MSKSIGRTVFGAIENAAWDLLGRHLGTPLHDLLGGPWSNTIPAVLRLQVPTDSAADTTPFVTHARNLVAENGFTAITVAASGTDWTRDAAVLRALREAFGGTMRLALDVHSDYGIEDARRLGRTVADLHLDHVVDPVRGRRNLTRLRRELPMPVTAGAGLNGGQDLASAVRAEAVDGIFGNGTRWGGIDPFLDVAAICRTFGLDLGITDLPGIGISLAVNLHLATVHPTFNRGLQVDAGRLGSPLLADWAPVVTDGHLTVPEGAGLGVNLDHQALAEHAVDEAVLSSPRLDGGRR